MILANRSEVVGALAKAGIETRPLLCGNMARQPLFRPLFGDTKLPNADRVHDLGLYLPNHLHLTEAEIADIAEIVNATAQPASFSRDRPLRADAAA